MLASAGRQWRGRPNYRDAWLAIRSRAQVNGKGTNLKSRAETAPEPLPSDRPLDGLIGYRLRRASAAFDAHFFEAMEGNGIRPALFGMLDLIAEKPGISQRDLGRSLRIGRNNIVPLVGELIERKLIERRPSELDRRVVNLFLTPQGKELIRDCRKRVLRHEDEALAGLSAEHRTALAGMLLSIEQALGFADPGELAPSGSKPRARPRGARGKPRAAGGPSNRE